MIFHESSLYRDKWDRHDYSVQTIEASITACHGHFHHSVIRDAQRPSFVVEKKGKLSVSAPLLYLYTREHLPHIIVRDSARSDCSFYVYRDGVYICYAKEVFAGAVKGFIEAYNPLLLDVSAIDKAVALTSKSEKYVSHSELNADVRYVNVKNGLLDVRTLELLPHTPKVLSTIQLPIVYDPSKTETPVFDQYLDILTRDKDGSNEEKKRFLLEFMGACFSNVPGQKFKQSLFMFGPGNTGKSKLKSLTEKILGKGNYMGTDLRQMEARFGSGAIFGKRLAGSADVSFMTIAELNIFKQATGGDSIQGEFKGKDKFEFTYDGLFWFCMNRLPKFGGDDGQWVYDRIIPFESKNVIPKKKQDTDLLDKMYMERDGIFNKAMKAFQGVIENDYKFHEPAESTVMRNSYRVDNNSALEFFVTMMEARTSTTTHATHATHSTGSHTHGYSSKSNSHSNGGRENGSRDELVTVDKIYGAYRQWYTDQNYNVRFKKSRKDFFSDIADYIGMSYEDMKLKGRNGMYLKDYRLTKEAAERYEPLISSYYGD